MDISEDYKQAALNLYPEDWQEFENGFRVDHNSSLRSVAEEIYKNVFEIIRFDEDLHLGVASAFLRRIGNYAPVSEYDKKENAVYMGTAIEYAIIKIRDSKK